MQFCPKCKALLIPLKKKNKIIMKCPSCNYKSNKKQNIILKEQVKLAKKDKIEIIDKSITTLPKTNEECPKCHHNKAYYWLVQTRAADEAATRFFRCTKCGNTWRSYS